MLKLKEISVNHLKEPIGLVEKPKFSWIISSDKQNTVQKSFSLQVAKDEFFENIIYKLEEESDKSIYISGFRLSKSLTKYYVRVKICDNYNEESQWESTTFTTGILDNKDLIADFVTCEKPEDYNIMNGRYLKRSFNIDNKIIKEAYSVTTALGLYKFFINGEKIGNQEMSPGWTSYNKRLLYQVHNVTSYLQNNNTLGVHLGVGWYKGEMGFMHNINNYGKHTGFYCQLHIRYDDGTEEIITTDTSWKGANSPVVFADIYDGEIYDATKEIENWNIDDDIKDWEDTTIIPIDKKTMVAQCGCFVKKHEVFQPLDIFKTPEGDTVIDFGQNLTGWCQYNLDKTSKGDVIELKFFETLDSKGNVYVENLRLAKQTVKYICDNNDNVTYEPNFTFQGFRYAKIVSFTTEPKKEHFTAYAVYSDMEETGTFSCSNSDLNQLQHNISWGLRGNFLDIPTDCPQRDERLGWTGDAQIFCRTSSFIRDTYTFFSKWLKDVEADQTPEGGVPNIVPDLLSDGRGDPTGLLKDGEHSAAAWGDVAVINPYVLYQTYGDIDIIKNQYNSMKKWVKFMEGNSNDYIWNYKLQFGDWVALDAEEGSYFGATPNDLTCTAYFANSANLLSKMAKIIGKEGDSKYFGNLYSKILNKFQRTFFNEDGTMTAQTQTSHILALYFDLVPDKFKSVVTKGLLRLLEKENWHLVTGFVGTPAFCHALSDNGLKKEAYDLLLKDDFPSWLYQVKMGATTVWEHWDGLKPDGTMWSPNMNSFNHYAYGAIGEWMYKNILGLSLDENNVGYKHFYIAPKIGGDLTEVNGTFKSVYGEISIDYTNLNSTITLNFSIPVNTSATVIVEGDPSNDFVKDEDSYKCTFGSGDYSITYKI